MTINSVCVYIIDFNYLYIDHKHVGVFVRQCNASRGTINDNRIRRHLDDHHNESQFILIDDG